MADRQSRGARRRVVRPGSPRVCPVARRFALGRLDSAPSSPGQPRRPAV